MKTRLVCALILALLLPAGAHAQALWGPPNQLGAKPTILAPGLACDGSTDDTAALQAAVTRAEAMAAPGGGVLQLPPGVCIVNGTISVTTGLAIRGAGNAEVFSSDNSGTLIIQKVNADVFQVETMAAVSIRDVYIAGYNAYETGGAPNSAGACISLNGSSGGGVNNYNAFSLIDNVGCTGMYDGLRLDEADHLRVRDFQAIGFAHDGILKINSQNPDGGDDSYSGVNLWAFGTSSYGTEGASPFATVSGSNVVTVAHDTTGLVPGMIAVWNNGNSITVNGTAIAGYKVIQSIVDSGHLTILGAGNASSTGSGGGTPLYWYGPFAGFEYRAGGDVAITGSKLIGGCFGFVDNATYGPTGTMRIAADSIEQSGCAGVAAIQAVSGVSHAFLEVTGNQFQTNFGTNAGLVYGEFYIGGGTPAAWMGKATFAGNTIADANFSSAASAVNVAGGDDIVITGNTISNYSAAGAHAISIGGTATRVVEYGNEAVDVPSGKYGTMLASSLDTLSSRNQLSLQFGTAVAHNEAALELDSTTGSLFNAFSIDSTGFGSEMQFEQGGVTVHQIKSWNNGSHWLLDLTEANSAGLEIQDNGHLASLGGTAPAPSSCGTSPAVGGNDVRGTVTIGSGTVTACTVTFHVAYDSTPTVVLTGIGTGSAVVSLSALSASAFTIAASASIAGQKIGYRVMQ
ncbi:MAG TPA: glycosyl hydrolase family 28-related protein [Stellaceae bacterium]|nr:glycosyl hydrolase family 28-related protein [Stellaceae bacterium]